MSFSIGGSATLKQALINECGLTAFSTDTISHYNYLIPKTGSVKTLCGDSGDKQKIHFNLPQDWDAAVIHLNNFFKEGFNVEGYTAEFKNNRVSFGCRTLVKDDVATLIRAVQILNYLGNGSEITNVGVKFPKDTVTLEMLRVIDAKLV